MTRLVGDGLCTTAHCSREPAGSRATADNCRESAQVVPVSAATAQNLKKNRDEAAQTVCDQRDGGRAGPWPVAADCKIYNPRESSYQQLGCVPIDNP